MTADTGTTFGASLDPYGRGVLTAKTRWLLAGGVRMGTVNGDTGQVHGPEWHRPRASVAHVDPCPSCSGMGTILAIRGYGACVTAEGGPRRYECGRCGGDGVERLAVAS